MECYRQAVAIVQLSLAQPDPSDAQGLIATAWKQHYTAGAYTASDKALRVRRVWLREAKYS